MNPKFLIDVPPPTISGLLHMGHVFSYCHMDFIARWQRWGLMEDKWENGTVINGPDPLLYPFCFDCNGLPTEKLAHSTSSRRITGQEQIVSFAEEMSAMYAELFKNIGMAWSPHRFHTFDANAIALAEMSFADLKAKGYAYKATREYFWCPKHQVSVSQAEIDDEGRYERSGEKVEIRTGEGWFINMLDHLPRIRQAIEDIAWTSDHFSITLPDQGSSKAQPIVFKDRLIAWLDDLKYDWSISRERNYGIHIPGEPENIVFDTWFTSSLSPQMAWASHTSKPSLQCPIFDARFQAHDIIRTWALFTIVKSLYHNNQIPWKRIVISGHALDRNGKKISKSAGNFVPPQTYIDKYGMHGIRYWAALNQVGTDTRCDEKQMEKGKKLVNKIKNAYRFLRMGEAKGGKNQEYWIEYCKVQGRVQTYFDDYNWPLALHTLTDFFWHTFCDKWIEECKTTPMYETLGEIFQGLMGEFGMIFFPGLHEMLMEDLRHEPK